MTIENLDSMTEQVSEERRKKYHLTEISNDREQIREISEKAIKYVRDLYPDIPDLPDWGICTFATIEFMKGAYTFLSNKRDKNMNKVVFNFGEFFEMSIEFGTTKNADKDATFNPMFIVGDELKYYNESPDKNKIKKDVPVLDLNSDIEFIAKLAQNGLKTVGIVFEDWRDIVHIVVAMLRLIRDFLIRERDSNEWGVRINFAEIFDMQIEKLDSGEGDNDEYRINMWPGKAFKLPAKSDAKSENNGNE